MTNIKLGERIKDLIPSEDFYTAVGLGQVPGWSSIEKFGANPLVGVTFEDVWDAGGRHLPPTEPRIHSVVSDDVNDAGTLLSSGTASTASLTQLIDESADFVTDGVAAGDRVLNNTCHCIGQVAAVVNATTLQIRGRMVVPTNGTFSYGFLAGDAYQVVTKTTAGNQGASVLYIWGLNAVGVEQSESVILSGTTPVNTVHTYTEIYRMRAFGFGVNTALASAGTVGVLTATAAVDGTVSAQIVDGSNQTLMAVYTIPTNKVGYVVKWWVGSSKKQTSTVEFNLRAGIPGGFSWIQQSLVATNPGSRSEYRFLAPRPIGGGANLFVEAASSVVDTAVTAGFLVLLKDLDA